MYLKSIEVHGFKSFANKIVFDFHNGITGIVGPNGSGKSNVADAVRWVLGEQRAKQLRGASMQDVIFAGTQNRKPLSYASVAITLDNSDHHLEIDYEEVTVTRRVYRSGESEYLINGTVCRLKDVNELFYDTGIGKEGYSIIGQGQIDRILSGKPEDRRELFDEAAGIVKFKRRKNVALKKLESERENLVRIKDILAEQERQLGPLEQQSQTARIYLKKKEELKTLDVNMFLLEIGRIEGQLGKIRENYAIADKEYGEAKAGYETIKKEYEALGRAMEDIDKEAEQTRTSIQEASAEKGKLEVHINVLKEQIRAAKQNGEYHNTQKETLLAKLEEKKKEKESYLKEEADKSNDTVRMKEQLTKAQQKSDQIQSEIEQCNRQIEDGKNEIIELLNNKASIKAGKQRYDTMAEQLNIRKSALCKRLLEQKSDMEKLHAELARFEEEYEKTTKEIEQLTMECGQIAAKRTGQGRQLDAASKELEGLVAKRHRTDSRLESLRNIAERYDGYGNSIRKVMEQRERHPGIHGVVADLIKVEKKYETAIETALGGNIQNIVTDDEATAKAMIAFLKEKRYGRATFLPLTSAGKNTQFKNEKALTELGVIGMADSLVKTKDCYQDIMKSLLGRIVVADTVDHATALARKFHYSLPIVTLEGEYLRPGGSISGGAFRNTSNLLGRNREMEELAALSKKLQAEIKEKQGLIEQLKVARELLKDDLNAADEKLQACYIVQNTAKMNRDGARSQIEESEETCEGLTKENTQIEKQLGEIKNNIQRIGQEIGEASAREKEIEQETVRLEAIVKELSQTLAQASQEYANVQLEAEAVRQKTEFVQENIARTTNEIENLEGELAGLSAAALESRSEMEKKESEIAELEKTLGASDDATGQLEEKLKKALAKREEMSVQYKGFFKKSEETSERISQLDKEIFRLNSQREKLEEEEEYQKNYMWEEYELTVHLARELKDDGYDDLPEIKRRISTIKEEIRKLGSVNVNAIADYKDLAERYEFLAGQRDDLLESEKTLMGIIEELDSGMRRQFTEKFAEIQKEFDQAFKELFGGGKGTLTLVEDEDILESGICITAQPPGKKLQNMMQLSGGEKALTAISLLFAIQNLKPSPFCLLDEIEAALDDSNVGRFAAYLHKLTKNTQFIIITHRRGTMAAADRLYGITMQEKGVSTLVSVSLIEDDLDG